MTPRGQVVSFPHSLPIAPITLSSVTIFLALSEVDRARSIVQFILCLQLVCLFVCFSLKLTFRAIFVFEVIS
jgi:hypothetical protein